MTRSKRYPFYFFIALASVIFVFRAAEIGWRDSWDLSIYCAAARDWLLHGTFPYPATRATGGLVFKYPPWILPLFAPFALLSWPLAKVAWILLSFVCIAVTLRRLEQEGVPRWHAVVAMLYFWRFWLSHFQTGQVALVFLGAAMWQPLRPAWLTILFGAKVFPAVSLAGIRREILGFKNLLAVLGIAALGTAIVETVLWFHGSAQGIVELFKGFMRGAASTIVVEAGNAGLTALALRHLPDSWNRSEGHTAVALTLALTLGMLWSRYSRELNKLESWCGWLALGVIIHPLAAQYMFVLVFPLAAVAFSRAIRLHSLAHGVMVALGLFMLDIRYPYSSWAEAIENLGVKSWGTILLALSLCVTGEEFLGFLVRSRTRSTSSPASSPSF